MMVPERQTEDGFEFHFTLNYLGHFLLTNLLLDTLKSSGRPGRCSRIINMSSATHFAGVVDMEDLNKRCGEQEAILFFFVIPNSERKWDRGAASMRLSWWRR